VRRVSGVHDLAEVESHVRAAIKRSGIDRRTYIARMNRFVRVARSLLDPHISFLSIISSGLTPADFYGAMWLLLVADTFRDDGERGGLAGDFFEFSEDEAAALNRVWCLLHDRYFGIPTSATVVISKDDSR
jgi:hypothetical protein